MAFGKRPSSPNGPFALGTVHTCSIAGVRPLIAPTGGAQEFYAELKTQLDAQRRKLKRVVDGPVKAFSELIQKEGVPPIAV